MLFKRVIYPRFLISRSPSEVIERFHSLRLIQLLEIITAQQTNFHVVQDGTL